MRIARVIPQYCITLIIFINTNCARCHIFGSRFCRPDRRIVFPAFEKIVDVSQYQNVILDIHTYKIYFDPR